MSDKLELYKSGKQLLPAENWLWPLYGAGFENLGKNGKPISVAMPEYRDDELLVRHDACGHCFSDIKVIRQGESHPRIGRDMKKEPVVLGHEVSMTVVGVGNDLVDQYKVGDRFIIQAEINYRGQNMAYGYRIQGGLSQFNVLDQRVLNGDDGCYLIPVKAATGYAESALVEPWACVVAAYKLKYRTALKASGTTWMIGTTDARDSYTIGAGFDESSHPARLLLTDVPKQFADWLRQRAGKLGINVVEVTELDNPPVEKVDDIVMLGAGADVVELVSHHLAEYGVFAVVADEPLARKVSIDAGRLHYNNWVYIGGAGPDIGAVYSEHPVRSELKPGGRAWFVGAGGPMGRMHVQRAIEMVGGPSVIVCTDISDGRLDDLRETFEPDARKRGIDIVCLNPLHKDTYAADMETAQGDGFDDIVVLAPLAPVISEAATHLADGGVMNIFAGVARGTMADLDLSDAFLRDARVVGHSASAIEDMREMLAAAEEGRLSPNRSVAAIGSLNAVKDGLLAVHNTVYPGKIVIYLHIKDLPITPLRKLRDVLPTVYAKLKNGREWTNEAEDELLRVMTE